MLRVVSAQEGSDYKEDLEPVIEEADDLSQLWERSGLTVYQLTKAWSTTIGTSSMMKDTFPRRASTQTKQNVSGHFSNRGWQSSAASPIRGLEQAARSYGFLRSLNLTGTPIHGLIDCFAVNVLR